MKQQYLQNIKTQINQSDLIVVGLGEEWNLSPETKSGAVFQRIKSDLLTHTEYRWILPYVYRSLTDATLKKAYETLFHMLEGKNYFVVATTVNDSFLPYAKEGRVVMPCGSAACMRDANLTAWKSPGAQDCSELISAQENPNQENLQAAGYSSFIQSLQAYIEGHISLEEVCFVKDETGEAIPFNSVYASDYQEAGYLPAWNTYMSWLQGTMNRKTCLLELGAGLQFPSVFRFPFEKMTYYNQKAFCFRVHSTLYQLTEEMAVRSTGVPMHAVSLFSETE